MIVSFRQNLFKAMHECRCKYIQHFFDAAEEVLYLGDRVGRDTGVNGQVLLCFPDLAGNYFKQECFPAIKEQGNGILRDAACFRYIIIPHGSYTLLSKKLGSLMDDPGFNLFHNVLAQSADAFLVSRIIDAVFYFRVNKSRISLLPDSLGLLHVFTYNCSGFKTVIGKA